MNFSELQATDLGRRQKNKLVIQDADQDVAKTLTSPSQETLIIAMKEAYEEMFNERLFELESKNSLKINQLMKLVEDLKNSNTELREENRKLRHSEFQQRGSSSSGFSETHRKKLEEEMEERLQMEMEEFRKRLEKETQEILLTKGITRERMRELEEEIKEELRA